MERILETFHEAYDEEDTRVPVKNIGPQVKSNLKDLFFLKIWNIQVHLFPETALELREDHLEFFYNTEQVCKIWRLCMYWMKLIISNTGTPWNWRLS